MLAVLAEISFALWEPSSIPPFPGNGTCVCFGPLPISTEPDFLFPGARRCTVAHAGCGQAPLSACSGPMVFGLWGPSLLPAHLLSSRRPRSPRALCSVASPHLPAPCFLTLPRAPSSLWQVVFLVCQVRSKSSPPAERGEEGSRLCYEYGSSPA